VELFQVKTKPCPVCGKSETLNLSPTEHEAYLKWERKELKVQQAFPNWTADQREMLMTGTHPACWDILFPPDEEDE
jgi:hypothetical protein